jgi:hypothetical protein
MLLLLLLLMSRLSTAIRALIAVGLGRRCGRCHQWSIGISIAPTGIVLVGRRRRLALLFCVRLVRHLNGEHKEQKQERMKRRQRY